MAERTAFYGMREIGVRVAGFRRFYGVITASLEVSSVPSGRRHETLIL